MSAYHTGNPIPSTDPRDLDDNATCFDDLLNSSSSTVLDRLNVPRKTWHQIELDAAALVSPNVSALAGLTGGVDLGITFTGVGAMSVYSLTSLGRTLAGLASAAAGRTALGAAASGANTDITSITGSAAKLTTARTVAMTGDGTWSTTFDGSANVTAAFTLKSSIALAGVPTAATPAVGTNTTQLATAAMVQAEIANKRAWTAYTPTITPTTGTFTTISATGKYMVAFGICYVQIFITVTTLGTGTKPIATLPLPALAGSNGVSLLAFETSVNGKTGVAAINTGLTTVGTRDYVNGDLATANGCFIAISGSYPIA